MLRNILKIKSCYFEKAEVHDLDEEVERNKRNFGKINQSSGAEKIQQSQKQKMTGPKS